MKLKLMLFVLVIIISGIIYTFLEKNEKQDIKDLGNETSKSIKIIYDTAFNTYKLSAQKEHHNLLKNTKAMKILQKFKTASKEDKKLLRGDLYRLYSKHYKYLKTLNVRQFHFHTHEGKSLLRFHVPNSNGDSLIDIRHSIKVANRDLKPIYGFEGGKIYPGFRYLFPIVYKGEHLGSIEYSVSFEAIEKLMKETFPKYIFNLHLDASISYDKVFKWYKKYFEESIFGNNHYVENKALSPITSILNNDLFINRLNKKVLQSKNFQNEIDQLHNFNVPIIIDNKGMIVSFIDIKNTKNKHAAYLISYTKNDQIIEIKNKYVIFYAILFLGMGLIFALGYIIIYQIEKIVIQNNKLEKTNIDQLEQILQQKDELQTIFDTTKDGIAIVDLKTNFLLVNKAYCDLTGFTSEELLQTSCIQLSPSSDIKMTKNSIDKALEIGYLENLEKIFIVKNGRKIHVNISIALMPDKNNLLLSLKDITELKDKENRINEYVKLTDQNIISSSTDLKGNITQVSTAFCEVCGCNKSELIGKNHRIIKHDDMDNDVFNNMWETITSNNIWKGEMKNVKKDSGYYWIDATVFPSYDIDGNKIGYTAIGQDITDKKIIEEISITDALTNIYNRRYFDEIFPKIINSSKRKNELVCFLILDIDYFKQYNDTYGHQMGDKVLQDVAQAIKNSLKRSNDFCFRLGGEEFGVIFNIEKKEQAIIFANIIRKNIEALHLQHEKNIASPYITASIGLICKNANDITKEHMLYKEADDLLYKAKHSGRNKVIFNL